MLRSVTSLILLLLCFSFFSPVCLKAGMPSAQTSAQDEDFDEDDDEDDDVIILEEDVDDEYEPQN